MMTEPPTVPRAPDGFLHTRQLAVFMTGQDGRPVIGHGSVKKALRRRGLIDDTGRWTDLGRQTAAGIYPD